MQAPRSSPVPWLEDSDALPSLDHVQGPFEVMPGLLAASANIGLARLVQAYHQGIFPWYSANQPVLWWCPDPRMVLSTSEFRLHRSLRKTLSQGLRQGRLQVSMDSAFIDVIEACAQTPRKAQDGTWIQAELIEVYVALHRAGLAHSVEVFDGGRLVGGLYLVNVGHMVYGESMFSRQADASKIALAALVAFCRAHDLPLIDCQQETQHLAFMGAAPVHRWAFLDAVRELVQLKPEPLWRFTPQLWGHLDERLSPAA